MVTDKFQGTDRFVIQRKLGSGMTGEVYEVFDRDRQCNLALKVLARLEPSTLYRFKQEFRALADVNHPNLVQLYDLLSDAGHWFFTMELVEGCDFLDYVKPVKPIDSNDTTLDVTECDRSRFDQVRLLLALEQITEGLMALHRTGKIHCDLKPSNVLVTADNRVVLLDLGLVRDIGPNRAFESIDESISGTPAYMSPEQGAGVRIEPSSDWYGFGVMLYEALTGRVPFEGSVVQTIIQKQHRDPTPVHEYDETIPNNLAKLCAKLLHRNPMKRPTGLEILNLLGSQGSESPILRSSRSTSSSGHWLTRRSLMQQLNNVLALVQAGEPQTMILHGPSGMGKSMLVKMFLKMVRHEDESTIVLDGRCFQRESVPYKALDHLIDTFSRFLKSLSDDEVSLLIPDDIAVLARLFPVLKRVPAVARLHNVTKEIPDSFEQRRRAFEVLRTCFTSLARARLLVIFIDDLQWGDLDSALLLNEVLLAPDAPPLLFVGCYRDEDRSSSEFLNHFQVNDLAGQDVITRIEVGELTEEESFELTRGLLGKKALGQDELVQRIVTESAGCPFLIESMVRYAQTLDYDEIEEELSDRAKQASVTSVIKAQLARLPDEASKLLEIIALAGQPIDLEAARQATELPEIQGALAALRVARLIRIRGERRQEQVECYHDKVREAVVEQIPPERLGPYHLTLAQTLYLSGNADPEALAFHFQEAGEELRAAEFISQAADRANEALAFDRASRLYQIAIDIEPGPEEARHNLRVKLGNALANAGRGTEAAACYLKASETAKSAVSLELQRRAAEQLLISGRIDQGVAVIRQVLQGIGMKLTSSPTKALISLVLRRFLLKIRGYGFKERDTSQISQETLIRIDTCWSVCVGLGIVDPIRGMDFGTRHLLLALKAGEPYRVARALAIEAGYSATGGKKKALRTQNLILAATRLSQKVNHPHALGLTHMTAGLAAFLEGKWRAAYERLGRAEEILRQQCTGATWEIDTSVQFLLRTMLFMGKYKEMSNRLPALLKDIQARGDLYAENNLRSRITWFSWLMHDESELAAEEVTTAKAQWSTDSFMIQHYWHMTGEAEAALYLEDGLEAFRCFEQRWPELKGAMFLRIQFTRTEALSVRGRCALAAWSEDRDPARLKLLRSIIKEIEREQLAWAAPLARMMAAAIEVGLGQKERGASLMTQAISEFDDTEMRAMAAAAKVRCGQVIEGSVGNKMQLEGLNWFREQAVVKPMSMIALLAPGPWPKE